MEKVSVTLECAKDAREVVVAIENMVQVTAAVLADGFQPGADLPVIVMSAVGELAKAIDGYQNIVPGFSEDLPASLNALAPLPGKIAAALVKKKV